MVKCGMPSGEIAGLLRGSDPALAGINEELKDVPITEEEIAEEVEAVRRERAENRSLRERESRCSRWLNALLRARV